MFGFRKLQKQNEQLRGKLAQLIVEKRQLEAKIKSLELSEQLRNAVHPTKYAEICGSGQFQNELTCSEYTQRWCRELIQNEIGRSIIEQFGSEIVYKTYSYDDKHSIMVGKLLVAVGEAEK